VDWLTSIQREFNSQSLITFVENWANLLVPNKLITLLCLELCIHCTILNARLPRHHFVALWNIFAYSSADGSGLALVSGYSDGCSAGLSKQMKYNSVGFSLNAMDAPGDIVPVQLRELQQRLPALG
jgi:hypothetical protein